MPNTGISDPNTTIEVKAILTRKHFEALAAEIRQIPDKVAREQAAHAVARACRQFNPHFDMARFLATCDALITTASKAIAEYDAQQSTPSASSAADLIRSLLTAVIDLHNGYPIRELHIDLDTLRRQAAELGVTFEDED